jgi:hypothetical protein
LRRQLLALEADGDRARVHRHPFLGEARRRSRISGRRRQLQGVVGDPIESARGLAGRLPVLEPHVAAEVGLLNITQAGLRLDDETLRACDAFRGRRASSCGPRLPELHASGEGSGLQAGGRHSGGGKRRRGNPTRGLLPLRGQIYLGALLGGQARDGGAIRRQGDSHVAP